MEQVLEAPVNQEQGNQEGAPSNPSSSGISEN